LLPYTGGGHNFQLPKPVVGPKSSGNPTNVGSNRVALSARLVTLRTADADQHLVSGRVKYKHGAASDHAAFGGLKIKYNRARGADFLLR
jgi:hypothetical protein